MTEANERSATQHERSSLWHKLLSNGTSTKLFVGFFAIIFLLLAWHTFRYYAGLPPLPCEARKGIAQLLGIEIECTPIPIHEKPIFEKTWEDLEKEAL